MNPPLHRYVCLSECNQHCHCQEEFHVVVSAQRLNVLPQAARANCCELETRSARIGGCNVWLDGLPQPSILLATGVREGPMSLDDPPTCGVLAIDLRAVPTKLILVAAVGNVVER